MFYLKYLEIEGCNFGDVGIYVMFFDFKEVGKFIELSVVCNKIISFGILELFGFLMEK